MSEYIFKAGDIITMKMTCSRLEEGESAILVDRGGINNLWAVNEKIFKRYNGNIEEYFRCESKGCCCDNKWNFKTPQKYKSIVNFALSLIV